MAISRVSANDKTGSSSATYPQATSNGNLLIAVVIRVSGTTAPTISGWTQLLTETYNYNTACFTMFAKTASGSETTITPSASNSMAICEYQGAANPYATDGTTVGSTASTGQSLATGNLTTSNANDLIFTALATNSSVTNPSWANATLILNDAGFTYGLFCGERIVSSTSTYSDTASWTSFDNSSSIIAGFKATATVTTLTIAVGDTATTSESTPTPAISYNVDREPAAYQDGPGVVVV